MRTHLRRTPRACGVALLLWSCTGGGDGGRAGAVDGVPQWRVSTMPTLHLGTEGVPEAEFSRIAGVLAMPGGEIVVADGSTRELRVFSATGDFVRALSRTGSGPGELRNIAWVGRGGGDTLHVSDPMAGVFSTFTTAGGFVGSERFGGDRPTPAPLVRARLASGALVVSPRAWSAFQPPAPGTISRDSVRIGLLPGAASAAHWFGYFPGTTWFAYRALESVSGMGAGRYDFGPQLAVAASGNRVWIGDSGSDSIAMYDGAGQRVGVALWPDAPAAFVPADIARAKAAALRLAAHPDLARSVETLYDEGLRAEHAPRFASFVAGPGGELWVERYRPGAAGAMATSRAYVVFDSTGAVVATAALPAGLRPHDIGDDYVLGVLTDDLGVETVARYGLSRGR